MWYYIMLLFFPTVKSRWILFDGQVYYWLQCKFCFQISIKYHGFCNFTHPNLQHTNKMDNGTFFVDWVGSCYCFSCKARDTHSHSLNPQTPIFCYAILENLPFAFLLLTINFTIWNSSLLGAWFHFRIHSPVYCAEFFVML